MLIKRVYVCILHYDYYFLFDLVKIAQNRPSVFVL